ncbi:MAG: M61 family metallopeptidase [Drouetiella hepatica Uher 2000/2452]|jgi:predicted metalloprotease with PDZ domain|uniref:M61 family metallopeptidase n=1 Tax=Drouetiella hepatica Uher 2000/2452 TaxID=904376 RepID=A0A951Q8Z0_9CYAN|nr:M61 family metallopeptidase [Drouetiella hepatica Uher 2000/2452]
MTEATQTRPAALPRTVQMQYQVAMPQPESHLFEVTLQVKGWSYNLLDLKMPVWTPGSYLVREYARHLQDFTASHGTASRGTASHGTVSQDIDPAESKLTWHKCSKNHWQIEADGASEIEIRYRIFANELTVRTNHLDATHGFFNGAALFLFIPGFEQQPIQVAIAPPPEWRITTTLPPVTAQENTFLAADFDTLVDSPFEIGTHQLYEFEAMGKPHQFAIWGHSNLKIDRLIADTQKVIAAEAEIFGGLPYDRYVFLLHLASQGFGGLEHRNSCTLLYSRLGFRTDDRYNTFMQLVAHEFFHLWNIKRIRPKGLEIFDYEAENYTPSLWFSEGTTSYYDLTIPLRAGLYDVKAFLKLLGKEISQFLSTPGRRVQSLSESSFDAWIKLYRRDANSNNSQISYYLKGEMVSLLLDLLIRAKHGNGRSLDDVLRSLWRQFGQSGSDNSGLDNSGLDNSGSQLEIGFMPEQLEETIAAVAETDLSEFFSRYLHTTADLPFDEYLEPFGLQVQPESLDHLPPYLGLVAKSENGKEVIKFVESGSPAAQSGIDPEDELLAIDGWRVKADQLGDRLKDYAPGDILSVTLFHQDELRTCSVILSLPRPTAYQIVPIEQPSIAQQQNFRGWLGAELAELQKS